MKTQLDHLVIVAKNLSQGVAFVKNCLGVEIPYGGEHLKMATHNHLMQLGNGMFLEVIAINPDMEQPQTPRWFGLDDPHVRQQIHQAPGLLTWVVNTTDINALLDQADFSFGTPELISRDSLSWDFGLPSDGRLLASGMIPYVIEWHTNIHPSAHMADLGCKLLGLEIHHPHPSWLESSLKSVDAHNLVTIHGLPKNNTPYLLASIQTPNGIKTLRSL